MRLRRGREMREGNKNWNGWRNRRGRCPERAGRSRRCYSEQGIRALSLLDATTTVPRSWGGERGELGAWLGRAGTDSGQCSNQCKHSVALVWRCHSGLPSLHTTLVPKHSLLFPRNTTKYLSIILLSRVSIDAGDELVLDNRAVPLPVLAILDCTSAKQVSSDPRLRSSLLTAQSLASICGSTQR